MAAIAGAVRVARFRIDGRVRRVVITVATFLCVAALVYSVRLLGSSGIRVAASRIGWGFLAVLALSGLREMGRAWAWTLAIDGPVPLGMRDALPARFAGEALNSLLPMGMVVGEPAKAEYVSHRVPFASAFAGLLVEFGFYSASLLLVFAAGAAAVVPPVMLMAGAASVACGLPWLWKARRLFDPVVAFARTRPGRVAHIAMLEVAYHVLAIMEAYVTLTLLGAGGAVWQSAIVLETVNRFVTIVFKMVPMRIGIDEATSAMAANALSLGTGTGLAIALVRKVRVLAWSVVGLVLLLARSMRTSRPQACAAALVRS
jgi:hypothetical protein